MDDVLNFLGMNTQIDNQHKIRLPSRIPVPVCKLETIKAKTSIESGNSRLEAIAILKPRPAKIKIIIETLTGKQIQIHPMCTDTIQTVKEHIEKTEGILLTSQILIFCGKELADSSRSIQSFGIQNMSKIQLAVHMNGGKM